MRISLDVIDLTYVPLQREEHLSPTDGDCPDFLMKCCYAEVGCKFEVCKFIFELENIFMVSVVRA